MIKRNNPGNIRATSKKWLGENTPKGEAFCHFRDLIYGCRAMLKLLKWYIEVKESYTIRKLVARWAPPCENNTRVYIDYVARSMDTHPDDDLVLSKEMLIRLASAMTWVEHNQTIPHNTWDKAYDMI